MKTIFVSLIALTALATSATAADIVVKTPSASEPNPWDVAFGGELVSDYNFRGITQSNHKPSVWGYFEPRYNVTKNLQLYAGIGGESISFPNRAAAEIDLYAGIRPTFGKLALDFGVWYYWYPGGQCFNNLPFTGSECLEQGAMPVNGNVDKRDLSFIEAFGKGTFSVNDQLAFGGGAFYSPSVLNSGAKGTYVSANTKVTAPAKALPAGLGLYGSAEIGRWFIGTTDAFYCTQNFLVAPAAACIAPYPNGIPYKSYTTWNLGFGITKSVFTLDFRYYDSNLSAGDCNAFTSDNTARFTGAFTPINPAGFGSNWCGKAFIVAGKFDLTASANLK